MPQYYMHNKNTQPVDTRTMLSFESVCVCVCVCEQSITIVST